MASWKVWQEVPAAIGAGFSEVIRRLDEHAWAHRQVRPVEVAPPFVAVVLFAEIPAGDVAGVTGGARRVTLGASGYVRESQQTFEIHPNWPMRDGQVLVFADWQQIEVTGIFVGADALAFPSPQIGEFKFCELGKIVRVLCRRREEAK